MISHDQNEWQSRLEGPNGLLLLLVFMFLWWAFFNFSIGAMGPGQVVGDLDTQKLEALDHFHFVPVDVDRGMFSTALAEVNDYLLRFIDIEGEIIVGGSKFLNSIPISTVGVPTPQRLQPFKMAAHPPPSQGMGN